MTIFTLEITPHDEAGPELTAVRADINALHEMIGMDGAGNPGVLFPVRGEEVTIKEWDVATGRQLNTWEWARPVWGGPLRPVRVIVP